MPNICLSNKIQIMSKQYVWLYAPNIWPNVLRFNQHGEIFLQSILRRSMCCLTLMQQATGSVLISKGYISMCHLTLECQATGSILRSNVLCEWHLTINGSLFCAIIFWYPWREDCTQPTYATCEYLVGKDILWNLDSEYLRFIRHKIILIRRCLKSEGFILRVKSCT